MPASKPSSGGFFHGDVTRQFHSVAMIEIRLAWSIDAHAAPTEQPHYAGKWMAATFENRRILRIILKSSLEIFGPGTHWIEKRRA